MGGSVRVFGLWGASTDVSGDAVDEVTGDGRVGSGGNVFREVNGTALGVAAEREPWGPRGLEGWLLSVTVDLGTGDGSDVMPVRC